MISLSVTATTTMFVQQRVDYQKLIQRIDDAETFTRTAYSEAISRMEASKQLKDLLK